MADLRGGGSSKEKPGPAGQITVRPDLLWATAERWKPACSSGKARPSQRMSRQNAGQLRPIDERVVADRVRFEGCGFSPSEKSQPRHRFRNLSFELALASNQFSARSRVSALSAHHPGPPRPRAATAQ